jgi:hypothetical protein
MTAAISALVVALALASFSSLAMQHRVGQGGHALDRSLLVGSGGYNRPVNSRGPYSRQTYSPGSSRALYTVRADGTMRYSPHNAFNPRGAYHATGYTGDVTSHAHHRRFRYQTW